MWNTEHLGPIRPPHLEPDALGALLAAGPPDERRVVLEGDGGGARLVERQLEGRVLRPRLDRAGLVGVGHDGTRYNFKSNSEYIVIGNFSY